MIESELSAIIWYDEYDVYVAPCKALLGIKGDVKDYEKSFIIEIQDIHYIYEKSFPNKFESRVLGSYGGPYDF